MTIELLIGLAAFSAITAFTPGPNNTLLMAAGLNHGFAKALPMVFGVCLGFPFMIALVGLGLHEVLERQPVIYTTMKYAGAAYLVWLAWKIAMSDPDPASEAAAAPPSGFLRMAAFQWINPKGWVMAVTALATYTTAESFTSGLIAVVAAFVIMGFASAAAWAAFGAGIRRFLTNPQHYRTINWLLAIALVASILPMFWA